MNETCRSCGAPIIWLVTEASAGSDSPKNMPVDVEPVPNGNVELVEVPGHDPVARVYSQPQLLAGGDLRLSHFVSCPDAAVWRR